MKASCSVPIPGTGGVFAGSLAVVFLHGLMVPLPLTAQESKGSVAALKSPDSVTEADFSALKTSSPFIRSLDLSQSLILTGIARIEGDLFATLLDRETRETHVVSRAANSQGWRMVGVDGNQTDLETVTARISVAGAEVFSVRFDKNQLKPGEGKPSGGPGGATGQAPGTASAAANYREGISGDGFRGPPPPEIIEKMSKLSEAQREQVIARIREIREKSPEVNGEERRVIFNRMLDRALQERR